MKKNFNEGRIFPTLRQMTPSRATAAAAKKPDLTSEDPIAPINSLTLTNKDRINILIPNFGGYISSGYPTTLKPFLGSGLTLIGTGAIYLFFPLIPFLFIYFNWSTIRKTDIVDTFFDRAKQNEN